MNGAGKRGYCREEVPPHPSPRPHSQESSFRLSSVGNHHLTLEKLPLAAEWKTGRGAKRGEQQNQSRCDSSSSGIQVRGASQTRVGTWRRREGAFRLCLQVEPTLLLLDRPLGVWWGLAATPHLLHSHYIFVRNTTASVSRIYTGRLLYEQVCLKILNDAMKRVLLCLE